MMKRVLYAAVAVAMVAVAAQAGSQNDSGCGWGNKLFQENKPVHQILAATTNSFFTQSFGITTGTAGCTSGGLIKASKEREVFTAANFRSEEREMAAGEGQYLSSLAALSGCQAQPFARFAKSRYESLLPSAQTTPTELLNNLDKEIALEPSMAKACGA